MSGPKTVNIRVHNQSLKNIIECQAELRILVESVENYCIQDQEHGFFFAGKSLLKQLYSDIQVCLKNVELPASTELSYSQDSVLSTAINTKKTALDRLRSTLQELNTQCRSVQNNYRQSKNAYKELQATQKSQSTHLKGLKEKIEEHMSSKGQSLSVQTQQEVRQMLEQLSIQHDLPGFTLDLYKQKDQLAGKLQAFCQNQEAELFAIQADYCNSLNLSSMQRNNTRKNKEIAGTPLLMEIQNLVDQIALCSAKEKFQRDIDYLRCSETPCNINTLKNLKSGLQSFCAGIKRREVLLEKEHQIMRMQGGDQGRELCMIIKTELGKDTIGESQYSRICIACEALEAECLQRQLAQYANDQEISYIKDKLIKALQDLNYEVVPDAKGFEAVQSSFLFKVPKQENYINVEYIKGKFFYNFLIPERVSEISREDLRRKVSEMSEACSGFLYALENLNGCGIGFEYRHLEASERHVISIPDAIRQNLQLPSADDRQHKISVKEHKRMSHDQ